MSHDENVHSLFEPDLETVRAHLEQLFRAVRVSYPDGRCEIAWDTGKHWEGRTFPITSEGLDRAAAEAVQANQQHFNVYMGVNPRKPDTPPFGRCSAEDVEEAYFNFIDADSDEAASLIRKAPLPYTWAVTTGRVPNLRPHAYWSLSEPCRNMEAWRQQQSALSEHFHTDRVIDPARLLRLAGTVSYPSQKKIERGYRVELVTLRTVYDEDEREPVTSEALFHYYPWRAHPNGFDPDTGEIHADTDGGTERPDFSTGRTHVEACIRNIEAGHELHNNARQLVDHLISTGHANWLIRDYMTRLLRPVSDGGTIGQIDAFIRTWRAKTGIHDPVEDDEDFGAELPDLPLEWFGDVQPNLNAADFVEGLLCEAGLSVLYGESNCGKTFFMTDLAFHISTGRQWRDRAVEQGGVIYVALEGGFGIRNRLAALKAHYQPDGAVPFGIVPCSINLLDANADTSRLIELIKKAAVLIGMPIKLVVIDTLARALNGGNENAPEDMGRVISAADRIREATGAHVAFVHHSGKDQAKGARGHSSLRAATDTEIEIVRPEDSERSVASVRKQRELEVDGEFPFALKQISLGRNRRGKAVTSCIVVEAEAAEKHAPKNERLTTEQRGFYDEICELFNRDEVVERVAPEYGMPLLRTVTRAVTRDWLIKRGKLVVTAVTLVTVLSNAERQRLHRVLNALADKGRIGINQERIWLLAKL